MNGVKQYDLVPFDVLLVEKGGCPCPTPGGQPDDQTSQGWNLKSRLQIFGAEKIYRSVRNHKIDDLVETHLLGEICVCVCVCVFSFFVREKGKLTILVVLYPFSVK